MRGGCCLKGFAEDGFVSTGDRLPQNLANFDSHPSFNVLRCPTICLKHLPQHHQISNLRANRYKKNKTSGKQNSKIPKFLQPSDLRQSVKLKAHTVEFVAPRAKLPMLLNKLDELSFFAALTFVNGCIFASCFLNVCSPREAKLLKTSFNSAVPLCLFKNNLLFVVGFWGPLFLGLCDFRIWHTGLGDSWSRLGSDSRFQTVHLVGPPVARTHQDT